VNLAELRMYSRFLWGLRDFLRHTITLEEAREIVRRRMAQREANFLRLLERGIFGYSRSPYLPLLKLAQFDLGEIKKMVGERGLEGTLKALRGAGVYITFEEFKGRAPIVRHGKIIPVQERDFDNPYLKYYYEGETGGTTGAGSRVGIDLDHLAAETPFIMLAYHAHGIHNVPTAIWRPILPDSSGINHLLWGSRIGNVPQKWFSPVTTRDLKPSLKYPLATQCIVRMARHYGAPIPRPEPVSLDQAAVVSRWAAETVKHHGACMVATIVSMAVRACIAAQAEGLDLTGTTFVIGSEPSTEAKVAEIRRTGARCFPSYHFREAGRIGMGCCRPADSNDLHFLKDGAALIQYPREVAGLVNTVPAFNFTTLLPTAPKIMLNVESDGYGVIEQRSCGCPLESYGYTEHLREIRSFQKLTGEGVTLVGSDMVRILEELLPARFGGSALDYQLLEEEDDKGFTRLSLLVSPKIPISDESAIIETVMQALSRSNVAADMATAIWKQAGTLQVKRSEPIWTARGKLTPLHLHRHTPAKASGRQGSL
jgi:hypothetical protein